MRMTSAIFSDICTFGDIGTESIYAKNREIGQVSFGDFGKFGDIAPSL